MANTIRALKLMASLGKLESAVPKPPASVSSDSMSPSEASSESEDEKPVKRVYKKKTVAKSDALPVHPSASMPTIAPTFVAPAKPMGSPTPPAPAPAPKVPTVRKPRAPRAKKLTAPEPPVAQPPPQAPEPAKVPEPVAKVPEPVAKAETPAEPKKGRAKKVKKAPSAYNSFVGKMMKEGKSMKEASAAWKAQKN